MKLEKYLTEKTFSINADVDLVYNKIVKPTHKYYLKGDFLKFDKLMGDAPNLLGQMNSGDLKSKDAKAAHAVNPVEIFFANDEQGNYYRPDVSVIHLALNSEQINMLRSFRYNMADIADNVGDKMRRFRSELDVSSIKGSIYHELSHWLNDSLHNKNITKLISRAGEHVGHEMEVMQQGHGNINQTFMEIDAQIHSIKQLKRDMKGKWNDVTWIDLMQLKSPFVGVIKKSIINDEYYEYMKNLTKRMHREKLLTKKLQKVPNIFDMWKLVEKL